MCLPPCVSVCCSLGKFRRFVRDARLASGGVDGDRGAVPQTATSPSARDSWPEEYVGIDGTAPMTPALIARSCRCAMHACGCCTTVIMCWRF